MDLFRGFVFDLDGTLVDSLETIAAAVREALAHHGLAEPSDAELRTMIGDGARNLIARSMHRPVEAPEVGPVLATYLECYAAHPTRGTRRYPGAAELLTTLAELGIPAAVCTNKPGPIARVISAEFLGAIPCIGGGDGLELKPHPAPVLATVARLGLPTDPSSVATLWMVGDSVQDILAGRRAGLRTWLVAGGYGAADLAAEAGPDRIAVDLFDIERVVRAAVDR